MRVCSVLFLTVLLVACARGEDPYRFYTWNVTYGDIYPLGVKQQVLFVVFVVIDDAVFIFVSLLNSLFVLMSDTDIWCENCNGRVF